MQKKLLARKIAELGYHNRDTDGYAFVVHDDSKPKLEIIGFDFEFYLHNPEKAKSNLDFEKNVHEDGFTALHWSPFGLTMTTAMKAASYALLEDIGLRMPMSD